MPLQKLGCEIKQNGMDFIYEKFMGNHFSVISIFSSSPLSNIEL